MLHHFDDQTRQSIAAQRAAIDAAKKQADAFARTNMDAASTRLSALMDGKARLGPPPAPDAYGTANDWGAARDQHTFATSRYARDVAEAEHLLNTLRDEHSRLLAEIPMLEHQLQMMVLAELETAVLRAANHAAEIAHVRQSFLNRIPLEQRPAVLQQSANGPSPYQVQGSGWADVSFFQTRIPCGGFGPDKSAALVSELGLS